MGKRCAARWGFWVAVIVGLGCGGESEPKRAVSAPPQVPADVRAADATLTAQVREKLSACGLRVGLEGARTDGSLIRDEYDRCFGRCHLASSCADVVVTTCEARKSALATCIAACPDRPQDGFRCEDGSRVPHLAVCDGELDCKMGEDEDDCAPKCADGTPLANDYLLCDQQQDCADGSDEVDCLICPAPQD